MNYKKKDITIKTLPEFSRGLRRLSKKYRSLPIDVDNFVKSLLKDPTQGTKLGKNLHKVRLAIASKGGGKSGGARVITHVVLSYSEGVVNLLAIYDKSECSSLSDKELVALMQKNGLI